MGHDHSHAAGRAADRGRLRIVLLVTASVLVLEVVGWLVTGSLALLADAGHMATDASMGVLSRAERGSLNMRGAINEVLADLVGSLLAVVAGLVIWTTGWTRADAVATLAIAVLIVPRAFTLARDATVVLLEIAP